MSESITQEKSHFVIELPFKGKTARMPNNRKQAEQRLTVLSKCFSKDAKFADDYKEFMGKVIEKGYNQKVARDSDIPIRSLSFTESRSVCRRPRHSGL